MRKRIFFRQQQVLYKKIGKDQRSEKPYDLREENTVGLYQRSHGWMEHISEPFELDHMVESPATSAMFSDFSQ